MFTLGLTRSDKVAGPKWISALYLITVCKDKVCFTFIYIAFISSIYCFLLNVLYCFKLTGNQSSFMTCSQWNESRILCTNNKTKRLIALMLCSSDYTNDQSLCRLAAVVDHGGLPGARGDESFRGRWLQLLRIIIIKIWGPRRYRVVWELAVCCA